MNPNGVIYQCGIDIQRQNASGRVIESFNRSKGHRANLKLAAKRARFVKLGQFNKILIEVLEKEGMFELRVV